MKKVKLRNTDERLLDKTKNERKAEKTLKNNISFTFTKLTYKVICFKNTA